MRHSYLSSFLSRVILLNKLRHIPTETSLAFRLKKAEFFPYLIYLTFSSYFLSLLFYKTILASTYQCRFLFKMISHSPIW